MKEKTPERGKREFADGSRTWEYSVHRFYGLTVRLYVYNGWLLNDQGPAFGVYLSRHGESLGTCDSLEHAFRFAEGAIEVSEDNEIFEGV